MDLHWRKAQARRWIELGWQEGLSYQELSQRSGASERTLRRWCRAFRLEKARGPLPVDGVVDGEGASSNAPVRGEAGFTELLEPAAGPRSRIQVEISLRLASVTRILVATQYVHSSAGVDRLVQRVRDLGEDPFGGDLFCFFNRRRDRVKLLAWDGNGFWLICKRIERGSFERIDFRAPGVEIDHASLSMLLDGLDSRTGRFRRHFGRDLQFARETKQDRTALADDAGIEGPRGERDRDGDRAAERRECAQGADR